MHDFHSMEYVTKWARGVNNPVRESVFYHVVAHLTLLPYDSLHVVELAPGPGILAQVVLSKLPQITYEGLDFSRPMLTLAQERLADFEERITLHHVDLRADDWSSVLASTPSAIISMQALHDVGGETEHERIYRIAGDLLRPGGLLLNADYMRRSPEDRSPSSLEIKQHLTLLKANGFERVKCTLDFSRYGCVVGFTP